jgi:hypothetical protein
MRKVAKAPKLLAYPAEGSFYDLLRWHLFTHGTRPGGDPDQIGKVWSGKEFADALKLHPRTVSNWLKEENPTPPQDLASVERVIFGDSPAYAVWRISLRPLSMRRAGGPSKNFPHSHKIAKVHPPPPILVSLVPSGAPRKLFSTST